MWRGFKMTRIECPMCQNHDSTKIEELDDRKKPLYFFKNGKKPMFAKKYHCTMCRYEWAK